MTKQENYNYIRQELTKAFPEMLELKFGCVLSYPDDYDQIFITPETVEDNMGILYTKNNTYQGLESSDLCDFTILGRPPLITDVLRYLLLDKDNMIDPLSDDCIDCLQEWYCMVGLSKPHLSDQSEEVIDRIYQLMKIHD